MHATLRISKYKSGRKCFIVDYRLPTGKRDRKFFTNRAEANAELERINRTSLQALEIPEKVIHEAWDCFQKLEAHGWSLTKATDYLLANVIKFQHASDIRTLVEKWIEEEKLTGIRAITIIDYRTRLKHLASRFGDRKPNEVSLEDVKQWNSDLEAVEQQSAQSRKHILNRASSFFQWCVNSGYCVANPIRIIHRPTIKRKKPKYFTVEESRQILRCAVKTENIHYYVLGLFTGIRPEELLRLRREEIKLSERIITLDAEKTKGSMRRLIELPAGEAWVDCVMAWLNRFPIPDRIGRSLTTHKRHFKTFKALLKKHNVVWINDGLRHTFATYHFAFYKDGAKTSGLLGHTNPYTLVQHYKGLATRAEAEQFYQLLPDAVLDASAF